MQQTSTRAPLAVCVFSSPAANASRLVSYPAYIQEILQHAGICFEALDVEHLASRLAEFSLLLTVGEVELPVDVRDQVVKWVSAGGGWISIAGVCGLSDLLGVALEPPAYSSWGGGLSNLGEGYLKPAAEHIVTAHLRIPLHYFNGGVARSTGAAVLATGLDKHQRPTERVLVAENRPGKGHCMYIAADLPGTVVRIQQGTGITRDGVPAPDGTSPVCDMVLKSDDGAALDWIFDRQPVTGVPGLQGFWEPIADQWRELLLRSIFYLASSSGVSLPVLWYHPRNLNAVGVLSHDTDGNDPAKARRLLELVEQANVNSTWCVVVPGYEPSIINSIRDAGHELAMHYDAMSEGTVWGEPDFDTQWQKLVEMFGGEAPATNKNHYLRWEGDCELFEWCESRGIQLDQSKGASKTGEAGFNFGTCHLFFPVRMAGDRIDVLELATVTQDLEVFAPAAIFPQLADAVQRNYGILHLLFHPAHMDKEPVAKALLDVVARAKQMGFEWWTARQANYWERARRQAMWNSYGTSGKSVRFEIGFETAMPDCTLMCLGGPSGKRARVTLNGSPVECTSVKRWGFDFTAFTFDAAVETVSAIELQ